MNWTTISAYDAWSWSSFYNNSTVFKSHFTADIQEANYATFASDLCTLTTRLYNTGGAGLTDSVINDKFTNAGYDIDYAEFSTDDVDVMLFKEHSGDKYYSYVLFDLANNKISGLHTGKDTGGISVAKFNTDIVSELIDASGAVTFTQSANNSVGNDYIIQPLYVYDQKIPLFMISGNMELAPFTLIQVQTRKFFVVGKGICMEVE